MASLIARFRPNSFDRIKLACLSNASGCLLGVASRRKLVYRMRAERSGTRPSREMALFKANIKQNIASKLTGGVAIAVVAFGLAGCQSMEIDKPSDTINQGYVADEAALAATPVGSSREQVLLSLGTPSTINTLENNEVFYYISQTRKRSVAFQKPKLVDQRVLAIYFGPDGTVTNIANYGLKDGKVFDFIKRVTPTGGKDMTFIGQILSGLGRGGAPSMKDSGDLF